VQWLRCNAIRLTYFPREATSRISIISSESVKIRKRKSRWVSDFRRACGPRFPLLFSFLSPCPLSSSLFHDACLPHAGMPNSASSQFKERNARRLISKRFLKVGGEKLKAPQAGNADSEFSRWRHERGRAMRLEVFEIVCRASRNINRA